MDQEKIGRFIAECRKQKSLTQEQLGEVIGVTSKSISRLENGQTMPDLSLLKPLSDELDISLNELLSGEKLEKEKVIKNSEKNLISTINYSNNRIKETKKRFKIILVIIITIILTLLILFAIDVNRMQNNKPVLFSTWGFKYIKSVDIEPKKIEIAIKDYLVDKDDKEKLKFENAKSFVSLKFFLIEEKNNDLIYVYAWVLQEKYYLENNEIKEINSSSIPYKFMIRKVNDNYDVIDLRIPRDGSYYEEDMKNIFPSSIRNDIDEINENGTIDELKLDIGQQIKLYFHR